MKLSDHVFVLNLSISVWGAQETDREVSDEVLAAKMANHKAGRFIKNILGGSCKELEAMQKFCASFRSKIKSITIPQGNSRFVFPVAETRKIMGIVKKGEREFDELVNSFIENYSNILEDARVNSGALLKEDQFPSVTQVERKFKFNYRVEPLPESNGFDTAFNLEGFEENLKEDFQSKIEEMFSNNERILMARLAKRVRVIEHSMSAYEGKPRQLGKDVLFNTLSEVEIVRSLNVRQNPDIINWCDRIALIASKEAVEYRKNVIERQAAIRDLNILLREMSSIEVEVGV